MGTVSNLRHRPRLYDWQAEEVYTGPMEDYPLNGLRIAVWARALSLLELSPDNGDRMAAVEMRRYLSSRAHPSFQGPAS